MTVLKILLVDDDELLAKGTAKLIQRLGGHQVCTTDNPSIIFQQCQSGSIDVVLMDVNLPGARWEEQEVTGADIARLLKLNPQTSHIPIILVTAYAMLTEQKDLLATSRADGFQSKPITDYDQLLKMIAHLSDRP